MFDGKMYYYINSENPLDLKSINKMELKEICEYDF